MFIQQIGTAKVVGESLAIVAITDDTIDRAGCSLPHAPANLATGERFEAIAARLAASHAYIGARGIAEALARGADVVVTGRVADASLVLGPLVHEREAHLERRERGERLSDLRA